MGEGRNFYKQGRGGRKYFKEGRKGEGGVDNVLVNVFLKV
jgi:hypothetical protein